MSVEQISKQAIAKSFGKAASSYDSVAYFQRWVGEILLQKIPASEAKVIVDLGCGTGAFAPDLQLNYPEAQYVGLDLSEQMVCFASQTKAQSGWLAGDAEQLPLQTASVDLVFSSLAVQWCGSLEAMFKEVDRVLTAEGIFVFSTLVSGSLAELKHAWAQVDGMQHVNAFATLSDYELEITSSGLSVNSLEVVKKVLHYQKVNELTRELKLLGAHNITSHRSMNLTGKQRIQKFLAAYEYFRLDGGLLPASYQVLFGVLEKKGLKKKRVEK